MADAKTEKQKVKEITDKLEEGLKELFKFLHIFLIAIFPWSTAKILDKQF